MTPYAPGLSRAHVTVNRFGLYRAEDGEHVALVNVGQENPLEMQDVVSTPEKLRPLAEATGGRCVASPPARATRSPCRALSA